MQEQPVRLFTVDEANALIPMLVPVLEEIRSVYQRIRGAAETVSEFERRAGGNGHGAHAEVFAPENDLRAIHKDLADRVEYLHAMGVQLKDVEHGVVDFPTRMGDRHVLLCWRLGEDRVGFWHEIETGFSGRRPL